MRLLMEERPGQEVCGCATFQIQMCEENFANHHIVGCCGGRRQCPVLVERRRWWC